MGLTLYDALMTLYLWSDHSPTCPVPHGKRTCKCHVGREVTRFVKAVNDAR